VEERGRARDEQIEREGRHRDRIQKHTDHESWRQSKKEVYTQRDRKRKRDTDKYNNETEGIQ